MLSKPSNRHKAVPLTPEQFHYAFSNTLTAEQSAVAYERYHVPAPGRFVFDGALANLNPHSATKVDLRRAAGPEAAGPLSGGTAPRGRARSSRTGHHTD
ncbi:hypothetical protein [Hyalangium gracile]|uniref:hypothetical protein n=1 Tax=Hyalangium gracile TaxID=394092 RepID=UPI001CCF537D|nr:hypothetical protein [Hyalangium gracile]